jgi:pyruvate dehydrogenase E1 component
MPMLPIYIYYSMFGFQRVGDLIWAAADQRARGFLVGATSGRTTLAGEGLQHQDGSSLLVASTIPNCVSYDPAYAYELAVIMDDGMRRMMTEQEDVFYYVTVTNENIAQPSMPDGAREGILRGMHCVHGDAGADVRLLAAGPMLQEAMAAAEILQAVFGIKAQVFSVTSFSELARDGERARQARSIRGEQATSWVAQQLGDSDAPVIGASDYVRALADMIRSDIHAPYLALGTDGFGRSDTRANLRDYFRVSAKWIAFHAAREHLLRQGTRAAPPADIAARIGLELDATGGWQ